MNEDQNEAQPIQLEIAPIEAITRAEVDVQIATARQYPRSLAQFYKRAEAMITCDQETAESCFYQLRRKDKRTGEVKLIEGESIRMAEIVACNFGNLRSAVHIVGHTPTRVSVRAVCHDLETNNLIAVEKQAKNAYSDGSPYNEDMAITTANALVSKALRDAIFRVVPKALIKPLKDKAKLVAFGEGTAFLERRKKALDWATKTRKVPMDRVLATLGVKGEEDISIQHLEILTGLKNAIMEGDQTIDEAFPALDGQDTSKANFDHPDKQRQEKEQAEREKAEKAAAEKAKAETKKAETKAPAPATTTTATTTPTALVEEKKKEPTPEPRSEPKTEPAPAVDESKPAAAATETAPVASTAAPEPEQPKVVDLTEHQKLLKHLVESENYTFQDLAGWGQKSLPFLKNIQLKDWSDIPDERAAFMNKNIKGVLLGCKSWKAQNR